MAWCCATPFQSDDGGWLEDIALLDGLVAEKRKAEAETIAAEGWKWIELPGCEAHRPVRQLSALSLGGIRPLAWPAQQHALSPTYLAAEKSIG
ncbi:hypothetical protein ACVWXL_000124 [Bradyrhizobium sp. GM22.5]